MYVYVYVLQFHGSEIKANVLLATYLIIPWKPNRANQTTREPNRAENRTTGHLH